MHALFPLPFPMDNQKTEKIMLQLRTQFKHVQPDFPLKLEVFPGRWIWLQLKQQSFFMKWNTATHSKAGLLQANYTVLMTFPRVTTWKYLGLFSPELCSSRNYTPTIPLIILVSNKEWWKNVRSSELVSLTREREILGKNFEILKCSKREEGLLRLDRKRTNPVFRRSNGRIIGSTKIIKVLTSRKKKSSGKKKFN